MTSALIVLYSGSGSVCSVTASLLTVVVTVVVTAVSADLLSKVLSTSLVSLQAVRNTHSMRKNGIFIISPIKLFINSASLMRVLPS